MSLRTFLDSLRQFPFKVRDLDATLDRAIDLTHNLRGSFELLSRRDSKVEPTYVYVLAPGDIPMFCCRQYVEKGPPVRVAFDTTIPIPPGAWIVAVGPAVVRGVILGNQWQLAASDYHGHVSKTIETWTPGTRLQVELSA